MFHLFRPVAAAAFALCLLPTLRAGEIEPLLPAETEQIVHINVKTSFEAHVVKKYALPGFKDQLGKKEAKDFLEELGFDPLKDMETITLAMWGDKLPEKPGDKATPPESLGVIHGNFDPKKLFAAAEKYAKEKSDVVSIIEEGDYKLVRFVGNDGKPGFAAVADEKTLVVGSDKKVVADAVAAAVKKSKPALKKPLALLVQKQDDKAAFYYCGLLDDKFKSLPDFKLPNLPIGDWPLEGGKITDGLKNLSSLAITVRLGKEIFVDAAFGMKDVDSADDFASTLAKIIETLKTLSGLLVLQKPNMKPLIEEIKNTMKAKVKDKIITLSAKVSVEAIDLATGKGDDDDDD